MFTVKDLSPVSAVVAFDPKRRGGRYRVRVTRGTPESSYKIDTENTAVTLRSLSPDTQYELSLHHLDDNRPGICYLDAHCRTTLTTLSDDAVNFEAVFKSYQREDGLDLDLTSMTEDELKHAEKHLDVIYATGTVLKVRARTSGGVSTLYAKIVRNGDVVCPEALDLRLPLWKDGRSGYIEIQDVDGSRVRMSYAGDSDALILLGKSYCPGDDVELFGRIYEITDRCRYLMARPSFANRRWSCPTRFVSGSSAARDLITGCSDRVTGTGPTCVTTYYADDANSDRLTEMGAWTEGARGAGEGFFEAETAYTNANGHRVLQRVMEGTSAHVRIFAEDGRPCASFEPKGFRLPGGSLYFGSEQQFRIAEIDGGIGIQKYDRNVKEYKTKAHFGRVSARGGV